MSVEEIAFEAEERMEKSVTLLVDQLRGIRTGRANTGLVESIRVDYYGSFTPLKQMANLSTPEPQQILIRPFDHTVIGDIVKAIQTSDLGLTPNADGKVVRLNVPPLSVEQRKKLANRVKELAEEARVSLRNIRRDANKQADLEQTEKILTEDDVNLAKTRSRHSPSASRPRSTRRPTRNQPKSWRSNPPGIAKIRRSARSRTNAPSRHSATVLTASKRFTYNVVDQ